MRQPVREGFFAFLEDIAAPGDGFALFGGTHVAMLCLMGLLAAAICVAYVRTESSKRPRILTTVALATVALEAAQQISFPLLHGRYWVDQIPLHLCGLSIFIELIHAYFPNKTTGEILYCLCLPGAVAALLFSNWSMYPIWNFYGLQSFVIHALHIAFPLSLLVSSELAPDARRLWRPAAFLAIVVPIVYAINNALGTNFFFVNAGSEGSPLEIFIRIAGVPGFLFLYAGLLAAVWALMYLPWHIARRKTKH